MVVQTKLELPKEIEAKLKKEEIKEYLKKFCIGATVGLGAAICYKMGERNAVKKCDFFIGYFLEKHQDIKEVFKPAWEKFYNVKVSK